MDATLYTLSGTVAARRTGSYMPWAGLPQGSYILRLAGDDGYCVSKKLIKK